MRTHLFSRSLGHLLSAAALAVTATGCISLAGANFDGYADRRQERFTVKGVPELNLTTFDGSIDVRAWDRPDVLVVVERRANSKEALEDIEVITRQDQDRIFVEVKNPRTHRAFRIHSWDSAGLTVSVPASANLVARSGDGSIELSGVNGRLDLKTGDGAIRGRALTGEVKAESGDGSIHLLSINGSVEVHTGDGRIEADGQLTGVKVRTGDGSVSIRAEAGSRATTDWDISTGDGPVTLNLPDAFDAELDAYSGDGRVRLQDMPEGTRVGHATADRSLHYRLGAGGRTLRLRTGDGQIAIRRF